MTTSGDRRTALTAQAPPTLNGIDFIEVLDPAETQLRVHFLRPLPNTATLKLEITAATITGGNTIPNVIVAPLTPTSWATSSAGFPTLDLSVAAPGDFSSYTLTLLAGTRPPVCLDRFFNHAAFSFKANCPSLLDCEQPALTCPPLADTTPPIDYLAKDFESFRRALLEFSALRYPAWQERSEADFGVMFLEALASLADDLSYQQDRVAAEGWLETATQRRSLVNLARLVDYEPRVACAARVLLRFEMAGSLGCTIPTGFAVSGGAPDGAPITFETGISIDDDSIVAADPAWNELQPYWWDDANRCLPCGATELWLERPLRPLYVGQLLLIDTTADPVADAPRRHVVRVATTTDEVDALFNDKPLTRVTWELEDAPDRDHDLTQTKVAGNLVWATHGTRHVDHFLISKDPVTALGPATATVRTGANQSLQFLQTLRHGPLAWLAQSSELEAARPELRVRETSTGEPRAWPWQRWLLDSNGLNEVVTLDATRFRTIDATTGFAEYDGADGATLRFGDGVFGAIPRDGSMFEVTYRTGGGARGNIAADTINRVDRAHPIASCVLSVTNPLPSTGGRDEESAAQVRELAPQQFRERQYRAVRAEDYERAAMRLDWVQRAGTQFRYTGSWLSVFTAIDPKNSGALRDGNLLELTNRLDRYRLAGYESFALAPRYASLDLAVVVCARAEAFRADVKQAVLECLSIRGFFHPDRFTFGGPLERSALEAAIQDVHGVDGVVELRYRRRGHTPGFVTMGDSVAVAADEIVRVDNDLNRPERGSLRVDVRGGK